MVIHYRKYVFFFKYINYFFHFVYLLFFYGRVRGHMLGFEIEQCCGMCSMRIPQTHTRHKRRPSEMILDKNKKTNRVECRKAIHRRLRFVPFRKRASNEMKRETRTFLRSERESRAAHNINPKEKNYLISRKQRPAFSIYYYLTANGILVAPITTKLALLLK